MNMRKTWCESSVISASLVVCLGFMLATIAGCPPVGPPASAILAGDWTGTDADGLVVTVKFNADGIVVSIAREDGVTVEVLNSTTELVGDAVTIVVGGRTFSGTLSADQNTITGTIDQEITVGEGDVVITIPAGDFTIDRVVVDPCDGNTCDDGDACNGVETCDAATRDCIDGTPVECPEGQTCDDGNCVGGDPCDGNTCDDGDACNGVETCDAATGDCVDGTPVECDAGETCVDGVCVGSVARTYVGSETCGNCHPDNFATFRNTGHPYKINQVVDGQMPTYPFSTIEGALEMVSDDELPLDDGTPDPGPGTDNTLSTPTSYSDVSYVIGGFGWKARFMDLDGFIVTGSDVQYNLETESMVAYHNNEVDKKFNCGNCHTTGWKRYTSEDGDDRNLNRQDDLPGMDGTFAFPGIQCEACHGAGSDHVAAPSKDNITKIATPRSTEDFLADDMAFGKAVACSDCHTRHAEKDYPTYVGGSGLILASGGLIRHHEQNDEMLGINPDDEAAGPTGPHASLDCIACHNPHTTTRYMDVSGDPPGMDTACTECHSADDYEITTGGMTGFACITCHMPLLAKSAVSHDAVGTGPVTGDIKTHVFRIDLTQENQFTEDGKFAYPWITGAFACKTCHNGETTFNLDFPSGLTIHN